MAQQAPSTQAVLTQGVDRAYFLKQTGAHGCVTTMRISMGSREIEHAVIVFNACEWDSTGGVTLCQAASGFDLHERLTTAEARTLAQALLLAADYVDAGRHLLSASQRHEAQQQADEVAA